MGTGFGRDCGVGRMFVSMEVSVALIWSGGSDKRGTLSVKTSSSSAGETQSLTIVCGSRVGPA